MTYLPITDHGLIGDLHTAALVGRDGRVVWLPWPRFDSPSLFAALLDDQRGGDWLLAVEQAHTTRQRYAGESAVLVTEFEAPGGRAELYDWMSPWQGQAPGHDLCRLLRCTAGEVAVSCRFDPRPDYATRQAQLSINQSTLTFEAHGEQFYLDCSHGWELVDGQACYRTLLREGQELRYALSSGVRVPCSAIDDDLRVTRTFWQRWIDRCEYDGLWAAAVRRSAITLKLMVYAPSGAIVAAPTTSLPEGIGGVRNWDYRYTWLRDASLTLYAFYLLGFREEADAFFHWLAARAEEHTPLQIMYGIDGRARLDELELSHLEGYMGSRPVRIGNAAYQQRQLDVYGGVIDAAYVYEQRSRQSDLLSPEQWAVLSHEIEYVCNHWQEPDQGIWEMRGPPAQHTFSKLMCWVAVDRGIRLGRHEGWIHSPRRWMSRRKAIHKSILQHAWNEQLGAFTQSYGSMALDASLLVMPLVGFLPADDPRVRATVQRISEQLTQGPLVYRYLADDHLPGHEGAFLLCSYWLVDALAMLGQVDQAAQHFEQLLGYASPHGLLAEEVEPASGMALGNYPQAFSHIGLINSALNLTRALTRPEHPPAPGTGEHGQLSR